MPYLVRIKVLMVTVLWCSLDDGQFLLQQQERELQRSPHIQAPGAESVFPCIKVFAYHCHYS